jgi:hypothetical protein
VAQRLRHAVAMALPIRFARSGDVSIAFHTLGDGPVDLVYVEGSYTHL